MILLIAKLYEFIYGSKAITLLAPFKAKYMAVSPMFAPISITVSPLGFRYL